MTKFHFNFLFSKAWFQALTHANLITGFKTCGVYPLNRSAISVLPGGSTLSSNDDPSHVVASSDENIPTFNRTNEDGEVNLCNNELDGNALEMENLVDNVVFNSEQEELFQKLFEEGYNLCTDPHYNHWLEISHPEVSLLNEKASFSDIDPSGSTAEVTTEGKDFEFELNSPKEQLLIQELQTPPLIPLVSPHLHCFTVHLLIVLHCPSS